MALLQCRLNVVTLLVQPLRTFAAYLSPSDIFEFVIPPPYTSQMSASSSGVLVPVVPGPCLGVSR